MLQDELSNAIKLMKQKDAVENAAENVEIKKMNDKEYNAIVTDFYGSVNKLSKASKAMDYTLSAESFDLLMEGVEKIEGVISSGVVDETELSNTKQLMRKINPSLSKEWRMFHQKKVSGSVAKLNSLGKLAHNADWVETTRKNLSDGSEWNGLSIEEDGKHSRLDLFAEGIKNIDQLEESLNLSEAVKVFLLQVTSGKARISDLNQDVINWIKNEGLEEKFIVCFNA